MAVNEKAVYATTHVSHGRTIFRPGERMDERLPADVIKHAEEGGLTTRSHAEAERAKAGEQERQERVAQEQATRSSREE